MSFTDGAGNAESVTGAATSAVAPKPDTPVVPKPNSPATGKPTISGKTQVGETLTINASSIADADGLGTFSYRWLAADSPISGATGSSHTLTASEMDKSIRVRVSFTDGAGNAESLFSGTTPIVSARPAAAQAGVSVSDARVSESSSPDGQHLEFTVSLGIPAERFVLANFTTRDGTAMTEDSDYYSLSGTLIFLFGEREKVVRVYVPPDDGQDEGEETMELVLTSVRGAPIADGVGVGTIVD